MKSVEKADASERKSSEVLVIEDDVLQAHEIEVHLGRLGFSVTKLGGGSGSFQNIVNIDPKVVIIDHHLPDMDAAPA